MEIWLGYVDLMSNARLMSDAVDLGNLAEYRRHLWELYADGGKRAWALQYQAEARARLEEFARIMIKGLVELTKKRGGAKQLGRTYVLTPGDYDPDRCLGYCYAKSMWG